MPSASSESGFSDDHGSETNDEEQPTTSTEPTVDQAVETATPQQAMQEAAALPSVPEEALTEDKPEEKGEESELEEDVTLPTQPCTESPAEEGQAEAAASEETSTFPLFIPSLRFMAEVPADMLPPLFPSDRASSTMAENYQVRRCNLAEALSHYSLGVHHFIQKYRSTK